LLDQVAANIRRGLPQVMPYHPNDQTCLLVAGGPSLKTTEKELVEAFWKGGKVVAVNGAFQWCIDRNIRPSAVVLMDARQFNARFVETPVPDCQYLLSSQCHPDAFELCRGRNVLLWHALSAAEKEVEMLDEFYFKRHHPITLGTTVTLRAISLLRMLGFQQFEIFGLDSCYMGEEHHAYEQAENDKELVCPVWLRPQGRDDLAKRFICSIWMAKQATDLLELVKERGELFELNVHGDGLIATMIRTGAQLETEEKGDVEIGEAYGNVREALEAQS
jgi:hypothetical protein